VNFNGSFIVSSFFFALGVSPRDIGGQQLSSSRFFAFSVPYSFFFHHPNHTQIPKTSKLG
jgi:hypothetical protein